ncbi:MAG: DUF3842 family protein [Faecalibacterium sp.]|nr:DUF3842 family protein [Faecalibacterium sp.]
MEILVIDGQGGKLGRQLVEAILKSHPGVTLTAVGTNSLATENMMKGGAKRIATGENAVIVNSRRADVILGPIGIVLADALLGEISPAMAAAVGQSSAAKILIPMNRCETLIAGVGSQSASALIADALEKLDALLKEPC